MPAPAPTSSAPISLLRTRALAERWQLNECTIRKWRSQGRGPAFVLLSAGTIRYRPEDIVLYEFATGLHHEVRA